MSSRHWDTAEAVAAAIAAGTFSESLAAARVVAYPKYKLADLETLRIDVIPVGPATSERDDRQVSDRRFPVNVVIHQQCQADDSTNVARLLGLLEEIQDFLEDTEIAGGIGRPIEGTETEHDPQTLNEPGFFVGLVSAEYRAYRRPD